MATKTCGVCGATSAAEFCDLCGSRMPAEGAGSKGPTASAPPAPTPVLTPRPPSTYARPVSSRPPALLTSRKPPKTGLVLGAIAVGVVVLVVWAINANQPTTPTARPATITTTAAAGSTTATRAMTGQNPGTTSTSTGLRTTSGQTTEQVAREELTQEVQSYTVTTDNHYLVELAAKWVGATDPQLMAANGTHTFYASDILAEYRILKANYGYSVHLVLASGFGKQTVNSKIPAGEPLYVTIYDPGTLAGKSGADSWCSSQFPGLTGASLDNVCLTRPASPPHT